ncbi:unnamed protein product [Peronospora destructor]|uniref:Uncharacterized protein n=1 Tax=Peronospora destructor TaxID=86335 RepID=A0AAV0TJJ7_9STRA|nr:unnamed protein product [Peronospora destructor]
MRFSVLVALVVAKFVVIYGSSVSPKTYALDHYTYDSNEVVRHLREGEEERHLHVHVRDMPAIQTKFETITDAFNSLAKAKQEKLSNAGISVVGLQKGDATEIKKVLDLAVTGDKKEKSFWKKVLLWVAGSIGALSFMYVLYQIAIGGSNGPPSTTPVGMTPPDSA